MNILRNYEIKKLFAICTIFFLILGITLTMLFNICFKDISNRYVRQNIALIGAIVEEEPKLEDKIVSIVTKGEVNSYYETGKEVMNKYYYVNDLEIVKNPIVKDNYRYFIYTVLVVVGALGVVFTSILIGVVKPIFQNLKVLAKVADEMVEGRFNSTRLTFKEGELSVFYSKFNHMGQRLEKALLDLKQEKVNLKDIINDISHQLKTPLAALISYNDILKNYKDIDEEAKNKFINLSSEQLDRMDWLITTLLKYARVESNVVNYNKDSKSLKETIEYAIEPLKIYAKEKGQNITLKLNGDGIYEHDKNWIAESISNIVKNAIEHTGKNGEIKITVEETSLSINITIEDNGEGIEKSEMKNVFKRFYKGKNSINPRSIGIGLSLSRKIIEAHGGNIKVDSELGKRTSFNITFLKSIV